MTRESMPMRWLQKLLEWGAGFLLCLMVAVGFLQVFGRYTGWIFVPWTEEVARLLFLWVVWLGAAAALFRGGHIRFDFVVDRLAPPLRLACEIAVHLGVGFLLILLIRYGYEVAQSQANTSFLTVNLSVRYTYLSAVVGSGLMLIGLAGGVWTRLRGGATGKGGAA
jgi:TRAP-type C4-dicarboxylate transport system permease small subunit